jgi:hypothetical protein
MTCGRAHLLLAAFAAVIPASCGDGDDEIYSPEATAACLVASGAKVSRADADYVARGERGYQVTIGGKILNIAFGENADEADEILAVYEGAGGNEELYREGNAVLSWDDEPGPVWAAVDGCLRP